MSDPGPTVFNGRYELHRRLGRGGMAEVFLARDQLLDRPVAVKVLFPEFATDPAFVERFRREATAAANLNHPNIVGVYDWGEADGTYFIVMEYVDGRTLSEILRAEGPLHPDRVADVGADVAAALGFAHRNGVVHRDVKPGNVLVTADRPGEGRRLRHRPGHHRQRRREPHPGRHGDGHRHLLLAPSRPAATPSTRAPTSTRSAACSTSCCVGRPPFSGDTPVAIAYKHVQESPVPPRQLNVELPAGHRGDRPQVPGQEPGQPVPVGRGPAGRPAPLPRGQRHPGRAGDGAARSTRAPPSVVAATAAGARLADEPYYDDEDDERREVARGCSSPG